MQNKKFRIQMTKDEMLKFYANKIVEDGIRDCTEHNNIIKLTHYNNADLKLEEYKKEILQLLYKDERIADVVIDDELNVDMIFYVDFCPFYYDEEENIKYNEIIDSPSYQAIVLAEFTDYTYDCILKDSYVSSRKLISEFADRKQMDEENKRKLCNFLKKSIIETGFVEKYIENISVYVTNSNYKELEKGLLKKIKLLDQKAKETMETEEFE